MIERDEAQVTIRENAVPRFSIVAYCVEIFSRVNFFPLNQALFGLIHLVMMNRSWATKANML